MSAYRAGKPSWLDPGFPYPVQTRLGDGDANDVLFVDVGGGLGHDLRELRAKHPSLPGTLVLQDRAEVIASLGADSNSDSCFQAMAHDFFTPQPVVGARAYYLHSVLHDWGDEDCVRILEALKPALRAGRSRVLVNELVVPSEGAAWPVTAMDQLMLVLGAMRERTEEEWKGIVARAGLRVARVDRWEMGAESLMEVELV